MAMSASPDIRCRQWLIFDGAAARMRHAGGMTELMATTASNMLGQLDVLRRSGALTTFQAEWLAEHCDELPDDWASHPYCRQVREHARAYIDRERRLGASRNNPQQKEHTHV